MRQALLLISLCLVALLMFASVALAETTMSASPSASASGSWPPCSSPDVICDSAITGSPTSASVSASALSPSGGVSPLRLATFAALLLVGSGLLSLRILRAHCLREPVPSVE